MVESREKDDECKCRSMECSRSIFVIKIVEEMDSIGLVDIQQSGHRETSKDDRRIAQPIGKVRQGKKK